MVSPVFTVENASYHYPDGRVGLADTALVVREHESLVVVGANASGKSTLLGLLAGLIFPTSGQVSAFGVGLTEKALEDGPFSRSFRQRVGVLLQDTEAMLFNATVYDEIAFGPLQLDLAPEQVRERVEDMLDLLGLRSVADQPPHLLSGGEQRKVALGAILAVSPEVLLFDEPTSGLDPRFQRWFVEFAVELRKAGKTLVTATHGLHIVEEIGDRVIVLGEDHRIAAEGEPHAILTDLDLLLRVNLVHEHAHIHEGELHIHPHAHLHGHEHDE
jgi:cobalt/nickel transport system ATP-binding protein